MKRIGISPPSEGAKGHEYDTTRTSPFGYYGLCTCGWITPDYWPIAQAAYLSVRDHVATAVAP